ncbi:uncharacterized protein Tco025E_07269 [Trypanosoma conorhini]|uniref:Uncharacterized protein n=1 Tax=Trypanosoma conorhini TaxID=83891 RepID=A0A422NRW5_9TRYP|nr:uncharacterized protein Tco025E_07269 [Trypanosoma conorhini]RNF08159.1 hypothetical protein Tco025E_07269 [Trypanosoma conorhini]
MFYSSSLARPQAYRTTRYTYMRELPCRRILMSRSVLVVLCEFRLQEKKRNGRSSAPWLGAFACGAPRVRVAAPLAKARRGAVAGFLAGGLAGAARLMHAVLPSRAARPVLPRQGGAHRHAGRKAAAPRGRPPPEKPPVCGICFPVSLFGSPAAGGGGAARLLEWGIGR